MQSYSSASSSASSSLMSKKNADMKKLTTGGLFIKQIDPAIDLNRPRKIRIEEGAETVTFTKYPSSSVSTSNIQFTSVNPPSSTTIVDRKIFIRAAFRLTFTGDGTSIPNGAYLFQTTGIGINGQAVSAEQGGLTGGVDGLRAFPLSQMLQSMNLKLNSQTFNQELNKYIEPLMRYSNYRDVGEENWSMTPSMQDEYQQYSDFATYGSSRNALGNYGESQYRTPRAGFAQLQVVSQTVSDGVNDTTSVVDFEVCEPIFISPLAFGKRTPLGLIGLTSLSVTLNISSDYAKFIWSHDNISSGKTIKSINLGYNVTTDDFVTNPEIMFTYYTPRFTQSIPKINLYPYHDITDYTFSLNSLINPGTTTTVTNNNLQLNSVPKRVFIYLRERDSDKTFNSTDTYARIKGVNITFGNISGLLSDANEYQLYNLSVNNGLKCSWSQWTKFVGSVLCLDFARQISTDRNAVVGQNGQFSIQIKLVVQNLSSSAKQYDIHTIVVNDGYMCIDNQFIDLKDNLGNISSVYDSPQIRLIDWEDYEMFYGSGFADKLRSVSKKALDFGKKTAKKYAPEAKALAKKYGPKVANMVLSNIPVVGDSIGEAAEIALEQLASGDISEEECINMLRKMSGSGVMGSGVVGAGMMGSGVMGGKPASKKKMKSKLNRY